MSIYGNISNAAKTNLTFDKIYPNRATMDIAAKEDGVLIGRYVLVEYNDGTEPKRKEFFLKDEDMEIINISHKSTSGFSNEERKEIQAAQERVKKGFNLYYWIDKPEPEIKDNNYEEDKVISWVSNEEKKNDNISFKGYIINPNEIVRARLLLSNSYQPVYKDKSEEIIDYIEPKADQASLFYFFKAREVEEEDYEKHAPIIFDYLGLSNEEKGVYDDYSQNYIIDNMAYEDLEWPEDGYDSTIWQKCVVNGEVKYLQIASLNSEFPEINIIPEAPSYGDVVRPYLDAKGTNKLYNLHFPTQWGFKIKEYAEKEGNPTDVARLEDNKTTHLGIYFNKAGFDKNVRHMDDLTRDNYIDFTFAKSKKKYLNNKGEFVEKDDIQELSISLPAVGDALCELYDTLYGVYDGEDLLEERNTEHTWGNKEGARAVEVGPEGIIFNKNNLSSLAGLINSTQDLMGQNVQVAEVSEKNGFKPLATADGNTIYYINYGEHTPEEGYVGPNFYRKIEKIVIDPIDNSDYGNYTIENEEGRKYYQLDQFEADTYYTKYNLDIKDEEGNDLGLYNFYLERDIIPDVTATYYHNTAITTQPIQLLQWAPYEPDTEGNIIPLYYKNEDNYIQVSREEEPKDIEYFHIKAEQKIYPDKNEAPDHTRAVFYNPEAYISKEDPTRHEYGSATLYDENGVAVPDEDGHIYYEGYFYMDEEDNNILIPVFNDAYREGETYYLIPNYYKDKTQVEGEGEVDAYYARVTDFNSEYIYVPLTEENIRKYNEQFKINLINFEPNKYFAKQEDKEQKTINYIILKSKEEIDVKSEYFTVEVTEQLTGEIENPENPEETINKRFYIPNTYFYLMELTEDGKGNYLLDRKEKMTKGVKYFSSVEVDENANTSGSKFYTPDKYYYADADGDVSIDRNDTRTVKYEYINGKRVIDRNTTDESYIYTDKNNGNELAYFLPRTVHIISDENKKYESGAIWNKQFEPPKELTIGIRKFPGDEGVQQSQFDAWEVLDGYGKDFNTINGIILNAAKKFETGNLDTRDEETVQGGLNCLKDQLDNFADLDEKQLVMVDGYGRINSCDVENDRWLEIRTDSWTYYDAEGNIIDIDKVTENNWARRELIPRIRLDHAVPGEPTGSAGQSADQVLNFNQTFISSTFATDAKGHVVSTEDHTITLPTLSINDATDGKVMIDLDLDQTGQFTIKENFIGNLPITEYTVGATANSKVEATDTLNQALGKLQGQLNLLNADTATSGSVLNTIIKTVVEADDNGAIDRLTEIRDWIYDDESGAAKIIADVAKNAKDIADNKTEYDANKILTDAAIEANTNLINSNKETTDKLIADNKLEAENAIEANTNLINSNKEATDKVIADNKLAAEEAIKSNTDLINSNKEATDQAIANNKTAIESNDADILALQQLVGEKSVQDQITEAITGEDLGQYALAEDLTKVDERLVLVEDKVASWDEGLERTSSLEALIDADKVAAWDKAEENVQADWAEEDETADAFIKNKPDLSDIVRTADLDDVVKTTTTFDYIYNETTIEMTISQLLEKIADLEARIAVLENPVSPEPEPEPEEPTPKPEPGPENPEEEPTE